jgi:pimeloyl-ACP methyl ester carboxylesterase
MNEATILACAEKWGDIPRFLSTAFVARDMDAIREALEEDELTAMLISYGTGIGQSEFEGVLSNEERY